MTLNLAAILSALALAAETVMMLVDVMGDLP